MKRISIIVTVACFLVIASANHAQHIGARIPAKVSASAAQPAPGADVNTLKQIQQDLAELKRRQRNWASAELWMPMVGTTLIAIGGWWLALAIQKQTARTQ